MDSKMKSWMSRTRLTAILSLTALVSAACARAATATPPAPPRDTSQPPQLAPLIVSSATGQGNESTPTEAATNTAEPFVLNLTPLPSETALPTLEVPTEVSRPPALQIWDGLPTYMADSNPGYYFRVSFDPDAWALTTDFYGSPALVHRAITNCIISPAAGHGLPPNATVDQEMRRINGISYQISAVSVNGVKQAVTYTAGDGRIFTAFQVSVEDRPDQCLLEAETVLGTLTSVPISQATPIATPSVTP
jgi:hypothetical protein